MFTDNVKDLIERRRHLWPCGNFFMTDINGWVARLLFLAELRSLIEQENLHIHNTNKPFAAVSIVRAQL